MGFDIWKEKLPHFIILCPNYSCSFILPQKFYNLYFKFLLKFDLIDFVDSLGVNLYLYPA